MKKRLFIISLSIFSFLFILSIIKYAYNPKGQILDLPIFYEIVKSPTEKEFEIIFENTMYNTIVFPRLSYNEIKVYLNNILIYENGYRYSSLWNKSFYITFDKKLLHDKNKLNIKLKGLYDVGIHKKIFLTDKLTAIKKTFLLNFINENIYLISIGATIVLGAILLIISEYNYIKYFRYLGLSSLFAGIYMFDMINKIYTGNLFISLIFRKIYLISFFISSILVLIGIEYYFFNKIKSKIMIYITIFSTLILLLSPNFYYLKIFSNYLNLIAMINLMIVSYWIFKSKNIHLLFPVTFLTITSIHSILILLFKINEPLIFGFGVLAASLGFGFSLVLEYRNLIEKNKKLLDKAILDPLTGAYNRNVFDNNEFSGYFAIIDINDLKKINDKYGHSKGDEILKEFVDIAKNNLRNTDYIIRLGGDEFAIITDSKNVKNIIERIKKIYNEKTGFDFSYGISSFKEKNYFELADKYLYRMKKNKK
ncbi:GGDEF domain-containing protein [Marinitoga sp. 38H-ov]|uniref:GGDEF domain-containing protein n=1 Tax=Marinitoga sp. 38H-ov TaxID=1755814 RepID=UPI0013EDDCB5|nr:GGDEF domain-containing protein [Marinitoga sp. 38H-ov]KAF2955507.1 hypothetical protein AS160_09930 [Marinitoga sp. 38H-ov]